MKINLSQKHGIAELEKLAEYRDKCANQFYEMHVWKTRTPSFSLQTCTQPK